MWKKIEKNLGRGIQNRVLRDSVILRVFPGGSSYVDGSPSKLCEPGTRFSVFADDRGRVGFLPSANGEYTSVKSGRMTRMCLPAHLARQVDKGNHELRITREGDMIVFTLPGVAASLAAE